MISDVTGAGLLGTNSAYSQLADEHTQRRRAGVGQELLLAVRSDVVEQRTPSAQRLAQLERLDRAAGHAKEADTDRGRNGRMSDVRGCRPS